VFFAGSQGDNANDAPDSIIIIIIIIIINQFFDTIARNNVLRTI
jgi:hypothetical protein